MALIKTINRHAFSEKIIHRYILEGLYLKRPAVTALLPQRYRNRQINAVIPEVSASKGVRPDLKIYFKDDPKPFWIEVKWRYTQKKNDHQVEFLKRNRGVLVSFSFDTHPDRKVDCSIIDAEDMGSWLKYNTTKLWNDTTFDLGLRKNPKSWLLVLRGGYTINWAKMEAESSPRNRFWAFKNQSSTFESIFAISPGDFLYVMDIKLGFGPQAIPKDSKVAGRKRVWMRKFKIIEPHFFMESERGGSIFENGKNIHICRRKWVHFISFAENSVGDKREVSRTDERELNKLWVKIARSANLGSGSPIEMTQSEIAIVDGLF